MGELRHLRPTFTRPRRRLNLWMLSILIGILILWALVVVAVVREFT